jgi:hypothetical protein
MSPVEVAETIQVNLANGASVEETASDLRIDSAMVRRFIALLRLTASIRELVVWGSHDSGIPITSAVHIARLSASEEQEELARSVLEQRLASTEVLQVIKLVLERGTELSRALYDVVRLRPQVSRLHVFIGAVTDGEVGAALAGMTQEERKAILAEAVADLAVGCTLWRGRLGRSYFLLQGGSDLASVLSSLAGGFEQAINISLRAVVMNHE